jgi:sec-independent protein translocase protein TatB
MFNFGMTEVMIIAVVGLIIIGPERLPRVARTLGHLFGRMQRYVTDIKADINREVELDELRKLQSSMKEAAQEIEESVSKQVNLIEDEVQQAETETRKSVEEAAQPAAGINLMHALNPPEVPKEETAKLDGEASEPAPQADPVPEADSGPDASSTGSAGKQA